MLCFQCRYAIIFNYHLSTSINWYRLQLLDLDHVFSCIDNKINKVIECTILDCISVNAVTGLE